MKKIATLLALSTCLCARAQFGGSTNTLGGLNGGTNAWIAANSRSNFNSEINVAQFQTVQLRSSFRQLGTSNVGGETIAYQLDIIPGQSSMPTNYAHFPANGTNTAAAWSNITLSGAQWFKVVYITNTSASTLTNKSLILGGKKGF